MNKIPLYAFALLLTGLVSFESTQAQNKLSIDNVYAAYLKNSGPIISDNQIKGYFLFYQSDKVDKKTNEYTLQILDENLSEVNSIKFTDDKNIQLIESSFNGSYLMFLFYDKDQKTMDYRVYDLNGKKKYNYTRILDKKDIRYLASYITPQSEETQNDNIFDIKDKGFVSVLPVRDEKKYSYVVDFYFSDHKKSWTYDPVEDGKWTVAQYLGSNDSICFIEVLDRKRAMSKDVHSSLLGLNLETGKKVFEIETIAKGYNFYPMNVSTLHNNQTLLIGPYYEETDHIMQDKTLGLAVWAIDNTGKVLAQKYDSWALQIGKHLKTDQKGRVEDIGYIYFHKVLQTADGNIFAIGEGYKKQASALGIASTVLTGGKSGISVMKMKVTDMLTLQFDKNFDLQDAKIYEKRDNGIEMPSGAEFVSPHSLALMIKSWGYFDYSFTQTSKDNESFIVGYVDKVKEDGYKGWVFDAISYYDKKTTTDRIPLKTEASSLRVLPAKPGSVMIMEYYKKKKTLDLRLEKLN